MPETLKLAIFKPNKGAIRNPRRVHDVKICGLTIPATEEELFALRDRLEQHVQKFGLKYGFFAALLGKAANYVRA